MIWLERKIRVNFCRIRLTEDPLKLPGVARVIVSAQKVAVSFWLV